MSLALDFPDQEHYEPLRERAICWRCEKSALVAKAIPNGDLIFCANCHREVYVVSHSKMVWM